MQGLGVFSSRFFWKLFLTYAILFTALSISIGWIVNYQLHKTLSNNLKTSLRYKVELLIPYGRELLANPQRTQLKTLIDVLAKKIQTRITFIDKKGNVIADSDSSAEKMENHLYRPEISQAQKLGVGYSERMSSTTSEVLVYMAQTIETNNKLIGFIRIAWPRESLEGDLRTVRNKICLASFIGIIIALVIAFFIARRVAVPIAEMMRVCDSMRQGNYEEKVRTITRDEIGKLGDTLNRLGAEITNKIGQISLEQAQLKTMLAGMVEGIIAIDHDNKVRFCNRAACTLLGSSVLDCRGMELGEINGFDILSEIVATAKQKRELIEQELFVELDNASRLLEIHASFFEGLDNTGIIIVLHDITRVRNLEKMRRDFVANVSHELKTPLTSIKGFVETLLASENIEASTHRRFLEKIERNAERLMLLVQDILNLANIEGLEDKSLLKPTDLGAIARQVLVQYEDQINKKNLKVEFQGFVKPLVVIGDKEGIYQIIDNLYSNAIRYTPQGGKIQLILREESAFGLFEVEDSGIGIPKKYLGRIFERFYRVDKARSREVGGTGLGLSIVKHLVSGMGGGITVESEVGIGSKFTVSLPLAR